MESIADVRKLPAVLGLQVEFKDPYRIEPSLLVILNIGHIEELVSRHDSGRDPFKRRVPALQNLQSFNGMEFVAETEPSYAWCHEAILYRAQRAVVKIEASIAARHRPAGRVIGVAVRVFRSTIVMPSGNVET